LILDKVVYPALILAIVKSIWFGTLIDGLLGALILSGFFALQYYISQGRWIGFGDVKLGLVLGMWFGWKLGLILLLLAYFIGAIVGLVLILNKKRKMGSELPLGSFLSISAIIVMVYGEGILQWYLGLLGL
jgi:prepilin signal peptidase PulO-like enzyme (type II secretory pathway)